MKQPKMSHSYAHMCRDDHTQIGHNDNTDERCPLCRALARSEQLEDALQRIVQWAEAYPIDIFHEPSKEECHRAHELLTANGMTLDAFSASMGRHCLKGIGDIARGVLTSAESTGTKP